MFKKILLPTDGSEHANKAARIAGDLAGRYDAELVLLHVLLRDHLDEGLRHYAEVERLADSRPLSQAVASIPEGRFPVAMVPSNGGETEEVLTAVAELVLRAAADTAKECGAKKLRTLTEDGDPAQRILQRAEAEGTDLIVMGSRGLGSLTGLLLGSNSHKVSQLAKCALLTVK